VRELEELQIKIKKVAELAQQIELFSDEICLQCIEEEIGANPEERKDGDFH